MSAVPASKDYVSRRGELLAELFLEDLGPQFVIRPSIDIGYDFLLGFPNAKGGVNNIAVELRTTERLGRDSVRIDRESYERWAHSNLPVLLLVVDAKENRLYFARPTPELAKRAGGSDTLTVKLTEIDDAAKKELVEQFRA